MSSEFEQNLEKYVEVILKVGLNLQKGQRLLVGIADIGTPLLELAPLVGLITKRAYQMGAKFVEVIWDDPQLYLIRFQYAPRGSFEEFPTWISDAYLEFAEKGDAILLLYADIPDLFIDQDLELIAIRRKTEAKHFKPFNDLRSKNAMNLTIVTAPVDGWTDKIFPHLLPDNPLPVEVVIEDFSLTFSKGRVAKATAKKGEKMLNKKLEIDEDMSRLGEIALVPHSSPISQSGIHFYNRLIDENASCHIALGRG